jgi:hypothetical protein
MTATTERDLSTFGHQPSGRMRPQISANAPPGLSTFTTCRSARSRSSQWNAELHTARSTLGGCSDASSSLPTSTVNGNAASRSPCERSQILAELHRVDPEAAHEDLIDLLPEDNVLVMKAVF